MNRWRLWLAATALSVIGALSEAQQRPVTPPAVAATSPVAPAATSPHGTNLREACVSCHRSDGWKPARISPTFRHAERTFPLAGAHQRAQCLSCHKTLDFQKTPSTCASCHTDPHKNEFGATCARCHNTRSFVDRATAVRTHQASRFPLRGAHAIATCEACHTRTSPGQAQFAARGTTCQACHMTTFRATQSPAHVAANFSTDCTSCHTIASWGGATFDHNSTRFQLTGKHQAATCRGCHADNVYRGKNVSCVSCHQGDYAGAREPRHDQGFPTTCEGCHTTATWKGGRFDHATTRFALTGGHRAVTCNGCHADNVYRGKPMACASCHQAKADATTNPHHGPARFAGTCESCHTTTAWAGARYDHNATRFPLTGRHVPATCLACHADKVYVGKQTLCASCHQREYDASSQPNHRTLGFPSTCETCHTTKGWSGGQFDHSAGTRFVLTGAHRALPCASCHGDNVYRGKPMTCVGCHQAKFDATTKPHHAPARFATTCESCHTTQQWNGVPYDHTKTRFPLMGRHVAAVCLACHSDRVYAGKPSLCLSCHQREYDASTQPNHRTNGLPTVCESCHTSAAWKPASFDHNTTRFPLIGAHRAQNCLACHSDGVYRGKPTTCVGCHQAKFDATTKPNHRTSAFPATCETCHSSTAWTPATFDHALTQFPLTGLHRTATCTSCHADNVFRGKSKVCASCHQTKFDATTAPNHRTSGFPVTCESCHNALGWKPATFDHNTTRFTLVGAHRAVSCLGCHGDGVYSGKPTTCVGCHQAKYDATTKPSHRASSLPTTCESCHTSTAWTPAAFDHTLTKFPLTGAHRPATCLACHNDGVYRGKPTACSACHTTEFNATTNPNHRTASFPMTCESCHTTTQWLGATFNHDGPWFPIFSGKHRGTWNTCAQCHTNSANYREFTCLTCHLKPKTDRDHNGANGYTYQSTSCYACHPRGN